MLCADLVAKSPLIIEKHKFHGLSCDRNVLFSRLADLEKEAY